MKRQISIATTLIICGLNLLACDNDNQASGGGEQPAVGVQRSPLVLPKRVSVEGRRLFSYTPRGPVLSTLEEALAGADRLLQLTGSTDFERATDEERQLPGAIALRNARDPSGSLRLDLVTDRVLFNQGLGAYSALTDTPGLPT